MAGGAGKYDAEATAIREQTKARAVALIVVDGIKGSGFSIQVESPADARPTKAILKAMVVTLDQTAAELRADVAQWEQVRRKAEAGQ